MRTVTTPWGAIAPGKIVCVGRNYVAHAEELGNEVPSRMVTFNKPNSAITDTLRARLDEPLHYEGEIVLLVRGGRYAAVGFGLDLTKRELQGELKRAGLPWERAKAFDGAALFSDFVALPPTLQSLGMTLTVDGAQRQKGDVSLMLFPPAVILDELQAYTTLDDGDLVMTGTPAGVGQVQAGACYTGRITAGNEELVSASWVAQ